MKIYALTGGIGSGKSTVARFFQNEGIPVIYADALNAEAAKEPEVQKRIFDRFGTIEKAELRKIIFADVQAKKDIEAIMHPLIQDLFFRRFNELYDDGHDLVVYEFPLVFELGQRDAFEGIISVLCPEEIRIGRVLTRDGTTEEVTRNIMSHQVDDEHRSTHSNFIIHSDCTMNELEKQSKALILRIRLIGSSLPSGDKPS